MFFLISTWPVVPLQINAVFTIPISISWFIRELVILILAGFLLTLTRLCSATHKRAQGAAYLLDECVWHVQRATTFQWSENPCISQCLHPYALGLVRTTKRHDAHCRTVRSESRDPSFVCTLRTGQFEGRIPWFEGFPSSCEYWKVLSFDSKDIVLQCRHFTLGFRCCVQWSRVLIHIASVHEDDVKISNSDQRICDLGPYTLICSPVNEKSRNIYHYFHDTCISNHDQIEINKR